jgi:hypothetical protein
MIGALAVYLAVEEIIRASFRPFLGFVRVENRISLRYSFYAAAVAVIIALRVVIAALLRKGRAEAGGKALRRLTQASIITLSLAEVPAILGLALFLLGGYNRDFYVFLFVSFVLVFMYFPRLRTWESYLQDVPTACRF